MICKKCGKEMIKGYIQCRDGVFWDEKLRKVAALPLSGSALKLSGDASGPFSGSAVEAYHCRECRTITIEY